jgi:hypothetical protein
METIDIHKMIEIRAYEIWQYRTEHNMFITVDRLGNEKEITQLDDWLQAKQEVLEREYKGEF